MILEKFMDLIEYEEFLTMPRDMLIEVIKQDSLEVNNELMVYRIGRVNIKRLDMTQKFSSLLLESLKLLNPFTEQPETGLIMTKRLESKTSPI